MKAEFTVKTTQLRPGPDTHHAVSPYQGKVVGDACNCVLAGGKLKLKLGSISCASCDADLITIQPLSKSAVQNHAYGSHL